MQFELLAFQANTIFFEQVHYTVKELKYFALPLVAEYIYISLESFEGLSSDEYICSILVPIGLPNYSNIFVVLVQLDNSTVCLLALYFILDCLLFLS